MLAHIKLYIISAFVFWTLFLYADAYQTYTFNPNEFQGLVLYKNMNGAVK